MQGINDRQDKIRKWLVTQAEEACSEWFDKQVNNLQARYYLYYKKGEIRAAEESPGPEWQQATEEYLSPAWPRSQAKQFILDILRKLDILQDELIKG